METIHRKTSRKAQVSMGRYVSNGLKKMKLVKWTEQYMAALNGRILLGRQRLVQSCGAIEKKKNRSYT